MNFALVATAVLLGLAGSVHCVAMCGATSGAALRACGGSQRDSWFAFHLGRTAGYALAGAVAAASMAALARWGNLSPAIRPLWVLLHVAALAWGLWMLVRGQQPGWLMQLGGGLRHTEPAGQAGGWQRMQGPVRAGAVGLAWVAWPCGLLQSALVVAALANTPTGGAAAMAGFALASAPALGLAPWLWGRWQAVSGRSLSTRAHAGAIRVAGAMLAAASVWALGHDLLSQALDWCLS
jgi:sulfite exporter TauE/SafE